MIIMSVPTSGAAGPIQGYLNSGPGEYVLPPGIYDITGNINIPPGVWLHGEGQYATGLNNGQVGFSAGPYAKLTDVAIQAGGNTGINAIFMAAGVVGAVVRDVLAFGGNCGMYTEAIDCYLGCSFIGESNGFAAVASRGGNRFERVKMDSTTFIPHYGFYQGDCINGAVPITNLFSDCDFSGPYAETFTVIDGYGQAISQLSGCVVGGAVDIGPSKWTGFDNCEVAPHLYNNNGAYTSITDSWGAVGSPFAFSFTVKANNINIA